MLEYCDMTDVDLVRAKQDAQEQQDGNAYKKIMAEFNRRQREQ